MEGQQLRDEIARVSQAGMSGSPSEIPRPPALPWAVNRLESEVTVLVELAQHTVERLRMVSTEEIDLPQHPDEQMRKVPERTGVQAADRILELVEQLEQGRLRIQRALDRVAV